MHVRILQWEWRLLPEIASIFYLKLFKTFLCTLALQLKQNIKAHGRHVWLPSGEPCQETMASQWLHLPKDPEGALDLRMRQQPTTALRLEGGQTNFLVLSCFAQLEKILSGWAPWSPQEKKLLMCADLTQAVSAHSNRRWADRSNCRQRGGIPRNERGSAVGRGDD